ncbi:zinc-binding dehydrogenase [Streptomyces boncukensis]|uniref:Zinc-binding dehydrogenase n=1 Tax=Streptomyces boncukensis TaxID=2711219 RepID=A0A6G4X4X8_9ACTN|nr:zinc-binding dehydrogenase [Streptomyces boncukensis]NGO72448.1 zinc-binding dehydrogenase [Streptomyces boncukensis]
MYAARLHTFGPAENLTYEQVPDPVPGPGQVRIAVEAAGVHLIDTLFRAGREDGPLPLPELPVIPGREVAGTVEALGEGTDAGWLGRRVTVHLGMAPGGYASLAVADADALHPVPDQVSAPAAVAMIGTGRTVMAVLRDARIGPADTVLVLAAAGGMGALLAQYAKHRGAFVVGAAGGTAKTALVRDLGVDMAVDYRQDGWADRIRAELGGERPVNQLFDSTGGSLARTALGLLAPGSTHFAYGGAQVLLSGSGGGVGGEGTDGGTNGGTDGGAEELSEDELRARGITVQPLPGALVRQHKRELEEESLAQAASGALTPLVTTFPLAEAGAAHRALETRASTGKVVLVP